MATPDLTLRARTQIAEPAKQARHRKASAAPTPAPRPTAAPSAPVVCFRWWYRIWCIRPHDGARHRRDRYPPYDGGPYGGPYGPRPRW